MLAMTSGVKAFAKGRLLALTVAMLAATAGPGHADDTMVDVRTLPRLEGAFDSDKPAEIYSLRYGVPTTQAITIQAARKLLSAAGWIPYAEPLEDSSGGSLLFKRGSQGLSVSFTQGLGRPDQSAVYYTSNRINVNVPFPQDASDVVFDSHRPYLSCVTATTVEQALSFFRKELAADGWSQLSPADIASRFPDADPGAVADGARAFFGRNSDDRQLPVMVSLGRRSDGRTAVDVRIAPFALPKDLKPGQEMAGLPKPEKSGWAHGIGNADSNRREVKTAVVAAVPAVVAFYRRELGARNWNEDAASPAVAPDQVVLNFSSAEETATLTVMPKYDVTIADLAVRVKESVLAARARAKKEADAKFMSDAEETAKKIMAEDAARRVVQAAALSDAPIGARADTGLPIPLPETADNVQFKDGGGELEFDSSSSVKALAAFYRTSLKSQGWKETPSVINKSTMVALEFSKAGKQISFTIMQMGPKVNVSADGSGLAVAKARPDAMREANVSNAPAAVEKLEADPDQALPVPKQHTMTSLGTGKLPGSETAFRKELDASVPASLGSVLAFYRSELGKLGWKETADRAAVKPESAQLAYVTPDGPATLKLGRSNSETTVNLVQKIPAAATAADVQPKPGQARLMLANFGSGEATLTINRQTIKVAPGAGSPQSKGPALDLPPGKYQYALKVAGKAVRGNTIELAADDAWGLMISPAGEVMALQVY